MQTIQIVKFPTYGFGIRVTFEDNKDFPCLYNFVQNELFEDSCNEGFQIISPEFKCNDINYVKNVIKEFGVNTQINDLEVYVEPESPF